MLGQEFKKNIYFFINVFLVSRTVLSTNTCVFNEETNENRFCTWVEDNTPSEETEAFMGASIRPISRGILTWVRELSLI